MYHSERLQWSTNDSSGDECFTVVERSKHRLNRHLNPQFSSRIQADVTALFCCNCVSSTQNPKMQEIHLSVTPIKISLS